MLSLRRYQTAHDGASSSGSQGDKGLSLPAALATLFATIGPRAGRDGLREEAQPPRRKVTMSTTRLSLHADDLAQRITTVTTPV